MEKGCWEERRLGSREEKKGIAEGARGDVRIGTVEEEALWKALWNWKRYLIEVSHFCSDVSCLCSRVSESRNLSDSVLDLTRLTFSFTLLKLGTLYGWQPSLPTIEFWTCYRAWVQHCSGMLTAVVTP